MSNGHLYLYFDTEKIERDGEIEDNNNNNNKHSWEQQCGSDWNR